jgi:alkylhydroperoxidase family enzyme
MRELEAELWEPDRLDPAITELVRDRVGQLLGVPGRAIDGTRVRTARDRAAVDFAEQYVMDPSGVTDDQCRELNQLFTEPELTALTFCVAVHDAMARIDVALGIETEPAER